MCPEVHLHLCNDCINWNSPWSDSKVQTFLHHCFLIRAEFPVQQFDNPTVFKRDNLLNFCTALHLTAVCSDYISFHILNLHIQDINYLFPQHSHAFLYSIDGRMAVTYQGRQELAAGAFSYVYYFPQEGWYHIISSTPMGKHLVLHYPYSRLLILSYYSCCSHSAHVLGSELVLKAQGYPGIHICRQSTPLNRDKGSLPDVYDFHWL